MSVLLNEWLAAGILCPYQTAEVLCELHNVRESVVPAERCQRGKATATERAAVSHAASRAQQSGKE